MSSCSLYDKRSIREARPSALVSPDENMEYLVRGQSDVQAEQHLVTGEKGKGPTRRNKVIEGHDLR